jgi:hypothetical protein
MLLILVAFYADPLVILLKVPAPAAVVVGMPSCALRSFFGNYAADAYHAQLRILLQVAPNYRWLMTHESICYGMQTKWMPLDRARNRIAREFETVTIGPDLDKIDLSLRQPDRCHMTADGQTALADALAMNVRPLL